MDRKRIPVPKPPAIAVEVISPSERTTYSTNKVRISLRQVQEVWQVLPENRAILIYTPSAALVTLEEAQELRCPLLPGWNLPVRQVFDTL